MSQVIPDQIPVWDKKHAAGDHDMLRHTPSPLAKLAEPYFPRQAHILELGCGVGRDATFFAQHGHRVVATDGSRVVIQQNRQRIADASVEFAVVDILQPLAYKPASFDVVYANLSLHYYSDEATKKLLQEIARTLIPGGILAFACKSYDSLHEDGVEISKHIFASPSGATIHLFSIDYARELLGGLFSEMYIDEIEEDYNGRHSKIVRCIATRTLTRPRGFHDGKER